MEIGKTSRGFALAKFQDANYEDCSIQDSSAAGRPLLWLGTDDANPRQLIPGMSWQPVPFPKDTLFNTRMHLSQEQVAKLLPLLQRFVDTGTILVE